MYLYPNVTRFLDKPFSLSFFTTAVSRGIERLVTWPGPWFLVPRLIDPPALFIPSSALQIAISTSNSSDPRPGNFSAHITFAHKEDALACILATDG